MGIMIFRHKGINAARVLCDVCGKPIQGQGAGMAMFGWGEGSEDTGWDVPVHFRHKGDCDQIARHTPTRWAGDAEFPMWEELPDFFWFLLHNAQVAPKKPCYAESIEDAVEDSVDS